MSFKYSPLALVPSPGLSEFRQTKREGERPSFPSFLRVEVGEREHVQCGDLEWSGVDEKALTCCLSVAPHKKRGLHSLISLSKYSISK